MRKYAPWIVGVIGAIVYFAVFETLAFVHPEKYATLSNAVATLGHDWPLAIWVCGVFCGGLACHFFWPWRDNPLGKGGG